jgi:tRNA(Leu) C34 or U34 (ribose-2'-O)-methylase TrmL
MIETIGTVREGLGAAPAIVGVNTKYGHNAASMLRLCSAYEIGQLWLTGDRWADGWDKRMPREERMKAYGDVSVFRTEEPLRAFGPDVTPVAVEVVRSAIPLPLFEHPDNPVYVFGPEDGSLPDWARRNCHLHVIIPTDHCLNLATAVATVLYDRRAKRQLAGLEAIRPSYATLREHRGFADSDEELAWTA